MQSWQVFKLKDMCTKKVRHRCFRCGRRLIADKLEDLGKNRFQCIDPFSCNQGVQIFEVKKRSFGHLLKAG